MVLALLQPHPLLDLGDLAVNPDAVALFIQSLEFFAELALAPAHHRRQHRNTLTRRLRLVALHNLRDDLVRALPRDRPMTVWAVRLADARPQQPQIVIDLCNRPDCRTRGARGRLLLDRDRRA